MADYQWNLTELRLITGGNGIFDVHLDEELLFSKHEKKRFPMYSEIRKKLVPILGEPPPRED